MPRCGVPTTTIAPRCGSWILPSPCLAASQEAYDANLKTYGVGLSDIVELLTAERDLATARYTLIQSRADLLTTAARVAYAAGSMPVGSLTCP